MRIILASKSPRRRELLSALYRDFEIITEETDETLPAGVHPREGVAILAVRKGAAVKAKIGDEALIISSDTLVELDGVALGKPQDEADAARMLRSLSGKAHNVHTGVAVHYRGKVYSGTDSTAVHFRPITEEEIAEYIASREPMDKAGSYAIQGIGGKFITGFEGDYDTVVGLSMRLLGELICLATEQ
jgi:septum formation protein